MDNLSKFWENFENEIDTYYTLRNKKQRTYQVMEKKK